MNDAASYQHGGEVWRRHRFGSKIEMFFWLYFGELGRGCCFYLCLPFFLFFTVLHLKCLLRYYLCMPAQSCPILCDPKNCSPPDSSIHGIFLTRMLEWVAVFSSRGSSQPKIEPAPPESPALTGGFFFFFFKSLSHLGSPRHYPYGGVKKLVQQDSGLMGRNVWRWYESLEVT